LEKASVDNILTVTSPCFELWLLLHYKDALIQHIYPHKKEIIENKKVSSSHTFISKLCSDVSGVSPKRNVNFSKIKDNINLAIDQEKLIVQVNKNMFEEIGSNVGILIEEMRKDPRDIIF